VAIVAGTAAAQTTRITNFAVVEVSKIQNAYFQQSARFREYVAFRSQFQQTQDSMRAAIGDLQIRRTEANRAGNTSEVSRLDARIAEAQSELDTYIRLKEQERVRLLAELMSTDRFYRDLIAAVQWVCNQEGFSGAFNLEQTQLLWWDPLIDITQKVIERMAAQ